MQWEDEGYLLSKSNFDENSIIVDIFTLNHGKCTGIVYGGSSRKNKKIFQIGNKIFINYKSKNVNKIGYFKVELIKPISPPFFDDKKRSICILAASSILKILLPEHQINKKIYGSFEDFFNTLNSKDWIKLYILWEISIIKELGFGFDLTNVINSSNNSSHNIVINESTFKIPKLFLQNKDQNFNNKEIAEALIFSKNLLIENFVNPNRIRLPLSRNILEKYFN